MEVLDRFKTAFAQLGASPLGAPELLGSLVSVAAAQAVEADGAGLGMFTGSIRVPLGASDLDASEAERLQFTLGEGPCLTSHQHQVPVIANAGVLRRWPTYRAELLSVTPYRLVASFPLAGAPTLGNLDLYYTTADETRVPPIPAVGALTGSITEILLAQPLTTSATGLMAPPFLDSPASVARNRVMIAIGMLTSAQHIDFDEALDRLRARAYSHNQSVDELATAFIEGDEHADASHWR